MALKCRCICGCKLLVSSGSAGKRIKCPNCERKLRVPADVVEKRRAQLEARKADPKPALQRSKIEQPLSSLVNLPDPEPPPIQAGKDDPIEATIQPDEPKKVPTAANDTESLQTEPRVKPETSRKPPPLPKLIVNQEATQSESVELKEQPELVDHQVAPSLLPAASSSHPKSESETASDDVPEIPRLETGDVELSVRGYEADRDKVATVRWLAAAIMLTGLVGIVPAITDVVEHSLSQTSDGLSRWACALLLVGVLQCAYAIYLVQLPDWSSVWVVTFFTLAIAASYAAMFGLTLLSSDQGQFVQLLDLADRLRGGKATAWCLIMLSLMSLTSYFSGRVGARWRNAFVA
ncbi:MAG: hypothetical protein O3C40_08375 [Planctomycetota bacterium]|nr:hypothetical protein [Planctomycetota bacterium]